MQITYGPHALDSLADRKLDKAWVERIIAQPDSLEPDPKHPERVRVYGTVPERDGRTMRVVYVPMPEGAHVVTMFLDRSRRRVK